MTDFGADNPFGQVPEKLKEHYGIEMPSSTVRATTLKHGTAMLEQQQKEGKIKGVTDIAGVSTQIGETDGCMIPIMTPDDTKKDKRKGKSLSWKEARLTLVHEQGCVTPTFAANFKGDTNRTGYAMKDCANKAGFGSLTYFHSVGDGATWIANQVYKNFGAQGNYLLDFYHVCEYLSDASTSCVDINPDGWVEEQKSLLKNSESSKVIENLIPFIEDPHVENTQAPVRACYRYLCNRSNQLDYKSAIEKGLPIGSGEIESAHRYIIQKRLKLSGAWWHEDTVDPMLSLRVMRANGEWEDYWYNLQQA
jgi:hypothetical protein